MAEIRRMERRDIPQVVALGEEFAFKSQHIHGFSVSRERIIEFVNVLTEPGLVAFVSDSEGVVNGAIGGIVQRIFFSEDIALQELVWYVKEGCRGIPLLEAFIHEGERLRVNQIIVGDKPGYCDLSKLYRRRGFRPLENQYAKILGSEICR